jgi:hypothetical protein
MVFTNTFSSSIFANIIPPGSFFGTPLNYPFFYNTTRENTQALLDSHNPNGSYKFSFYMNIPPSQLVTNVLTTGTFPNPPMVTNLTEAQAINPTNDFALGWNPFVGGRTNDLITCTVLTATGAVLQTSIVPGASNALNGLATSISIPGNTLLPGRSYVVKLAFATVQSIVTNQYPGATGATLYLSQSDFFIKTTGAGDSTPPYLVSTIPAAGSVNAPTNIPVVMIFNKPIRQSVSLTWSGSTATNWTDSYDTNLLRFALTPTLDFRTNQTSTFILNPLHLNWGFADTNGNLLAPETSFSFSTGNGHYDTNTPILTNLRFVPSGGLQMDLTGATNSTYVLLGSTNLVDWYPLVTNVPFAGTINFTDPGTTVPACYYRTVGY